MNISKKDQLRFQKLSTLAESNTTLPMEGNFTTLRGAAAAEAGRALLREALGGDDAIEEEIRRGRPHVGATGTQGTASPVIRVRVAPEKEASLDSLALRVNKNRSELMREAIDLLLVTYNEPERGQSVRISAATVRRLHRQLLEATETVEALAGNVP